MVPAAGATGATGSARTTPEDNVSVVTTAAAIVNTVALNVSERDPGRRPRACVFGPGIIKARNSTAGAKCRRPLTGIPQLVASCLGRAISPMRRYAIGPQP